MEVQRSINRVASVMAFVAVTLAGPLLLAGTAHADTLTAMDKCPSSRLVAAYTNLSGTWRSNDRIVPARAGDALLLAGGGNTRINSWGTEKSVAGEDPAPSGWPLPQAPKYGLIAKLQTGSVLDFDERTGETVTHEAGSWFYVGSSTGCMLVMEHVDNLSFAINDDNPSDNGDMPRDIIQGYLWTSDVENQPKTLWPPFLP